jgi:protein phosphatase
LVRQTKLLVADTTHEASTATGFDWWTELTAAGGEGMVVKPQPANLERLRQRGLGHKRSLVAREYAVRPAPRLGRW